MTPNHHLEPTPSSVRGTPASSSGSPLALDTKNSNQSNRGAQMELQKEAIVIYSSTNKALSRDIA